MSVARGFVGTHVFGALGASAQNGFIQQLFDCLQAGTFHAGVNTNNAAFPAPRLLLYRRPAGTPDDFGNYQLVLDTTGANGSVNGACPVNTGDVVLVSLGGCQADFFAIHTAYLNSPPPPLAPPGIIPSRFGTLQLTQPSGESGCSLWFRVSSLVPWMPFTVPVQLTPGVTVQAMATKNGRTASSVVSYKL